ncbi:MAG TPA: hemerythrin domain-containing protein [Myxococcaceae bacterium]|nr:hemerythrin domain-containing protein [Myxococcaceae bacterium]
MNRPNNFNFIHKAIRASLFETTLAVARTDFSDAPERGAALERVLSLLALLDEHAAHEEGLVFPELATLDPRLALELDEEHGRMEELQGQIRTCLERLATWPASPARSEPPRLHRLLLLLVADQLRHMDREETEANAAFWAHRTDAQLAELNARVQASIPPERQQEVVRLMLPALSAPERAELLSGARARLPVGAFQALARLARSVLGPEQWRATARAVGLDPVG